LGAGVDADDPSRPAEDEPVYRNALCGGVHERLPQLQVFDLRVGELD
jgi:hypothetical protein